MLAASATQQFELRSSEERWQPWRESRPHSRRKSTLDSLEGMDMEGVDGDEAEEGTLKCTGVGTLRCMGMGTLECMRMDGTAEEGIFVLMDMDGVVLEENMDGEEEVEEEDEGEDRDITPTSLLSTEHGFGTQQMRSVMTLVTTAKAPEGRSRSIALVMRQRRLTPG